MPKEAIANGAVERVVPLDQVAATMLAFVTGANGSQRGAAPTRER